MPSVLRIAVGLAFLTAVSLAILELTKSQVDNDIPMFILGIVYTYFIASALEWSLATLILYERHRFRKASRAINITRYVFHAILYTTLLNTFLLLTAYLTESDAFLLSVVIYSTIFTYLIANAPIKIQFLSTYINRYHQIHEDDNYYNRNIALIPFGDVLFGTYRWGACIM